MRSRSVASRAREAKQKHGEEVHKRREHAPCLHIVHPMLGLGSQESTMLHLVPQNQLSDGKAVLKRLVCWGKKDFQQAPDFLHAQQCAHTGHGAVLSRSS